MIRISKEFCDAVDKGIKPEIDGSDATLEAIKAEYAEGGRQEECVAFSDTLAEDVDVMLNLESEIEEREKQVNTVRNRVRAAIGNASYGYTLDGKTFSLKADKRGVRALKKLAKPPTVVLEQLAAVVGETLDV